MSGVPEKIVVEVGGEKVEARFSTNALCEVEAQFGGRSIAAIGDDLARGASLQDARALFRAVLIDAMPDLTFVGAGRILGEIGVEEAARIIQAAFERLKVGLETGELKIPEPDVRGRLALEFAGERLVLAFGFNAQAELEAYFGGLQPDAIVAKMQDGVSIGDIRAMFRAGLIDHREVSLSEAGHVMDRLGLANASKAAATAFIAAFPKATAGDEAEDGEGNRKKRRAAASVAGNPTKRRAKAGTGPRSPRSGPPKG